jgi:DNA-binding NarL/FixJ family response regulator
MADVVAMIDDIFFQAKVIETAKQLGVEVRACATPEALAAELKAAKPKLAIVDLNARANPLGAIAWVRDEMKNVRLIAFLSHVQTDLAEKARAAGCVEVMPRSKLTRDLATILAGAKSQS